MLIIMAAFFVYFSYDFYVDFLRGVDTNQTTVENMKDTYGIMHTKDENRNTYFGKEWRHFLPIAFPAGHNYLELSYNTRELNYKCQSPELYTIRNDPYYSEFYYDRYSYQGK